MKQTAALVALLTAVAIGFAAVFIYGVGSGASPLATCAPRDTVLYAEAPDLGAALERFRAAPAYADFQRSRTHEQLLAALEQAGEAAKGGAEPFATLQSLGLKLDEQTALRFVGQGVGLGVSAPAQGTPAAYAIARVDLLGLAKDLAVEGKWQDVWGKLSQALQGSGGAAEVVEGHEIVSRPLRAGSSHKLFFTQAGDQVFAATAREPVVDFLRAQAGKAQGLTAHPGWSARAALKREALAFTWVDARFWRDGARVRAAALALAKESGRPEATKAVEQVLRGGELDRLKAETREVPGLAFGLVASDGGPYAWDVECSHTAEQVFQSAERLDAKALAGGAQPTLFFEATGLDARLGRFLESKGWKTLASTEAWRWLNEKLERPEALQPFLPPDPSLKVALKHDPRFELRCGLALMDALLPELLGARWAGCLAVTDAARAEVLKQRQAQAKRREEVPGPGVDPDRPDPSQPGHDQPPAAKGPAPSPLDGAVVITLRPAMRALANVALGALELRAQEAKVELALVDGRKAFCVPTPIGVDLCFTLVGSDLVASLGKDRLGAAIKAGLAGVQDGPLSRMLALAPKDPGLVTYYDADGFLVLAEALSGPRSSRGLGVEQELVAGQTLGAIYGDEDCTSLRSFGVQAGLPARVQAYADGLYPPGAKLDEALLARLPRESFLAAAATLDPQGLWKAARDLGGQDLGRMVEQVKRELCDERHDPEQLLLPRLGKRHALALVTQRALPPAGAPAEVAEQTVAIPAALAYVGLEGQDAERVLVDLAEHVLAHAGQARAKAAETEVSSGLRRLGSALEAHKQAAAASGRKHEYARQLMELAEADELDWQLAMGRIGKHRVQYQRCEADPAAKWMAVASPTGPGIHFAINHEGRVVKSYQEIPLNAACELPADAVPAEGALPAPPADLPRPAPLAKLVKAAVGGRQLYRIELPQELAREADMAGAGFSPCFAFSDGFLVLGSSEQALLAALAGEGHLSDAPRFQRLRQRLTLQGSLLAYGHLGGVIDQVLENGALIARQAAPPPAELKEPARPEFPEQSRESDPKAVQKAMEEWQKAMQDYQPKQQAYRQALAKWRREHVEENRAALAKIVGSLRVLGGFAAAGGAQPGHFLGESVYALDPDAAQERPAAEQAPQAR